MGGRASRRRGSRGEYLVRDALRLHGYEAQRVPLSGACAYAKGDVEATKGGKKYVFEVKNIHGQFQTVYRLFDQANVAGLCCLALGTAADYVLVRLSNHPDRALEAEGSYKFTGSDTGGLVGRQLRGKLLNMRKLLKGADCLVIKDNFMPLLYIRYL